MGPAARTAGRPAEAEALAAFERAQHLAQLAPLLRAERGRVPDVVERSGSVVQPEKEARHAVALRLHAVPAHHAVGGAMVLHLHHHALALDVRLLRALGDDPVLPEAVHVLEPAARDLEVGCLRRHEQRRARPKVGRIRSERAAEALDESLELRTAFVGRRAADVTAVDLQQIERDERRRGLRRELPDARLGRMQPQLEDVEVEHALGHEHDLSVEHVARRRLAV